MSHSHGPVETHDTTDAGAGLGMVLGLVLVALLIGAVLWVAFAGWGTVDRGATGGAAGNTGGTNITVPRQIDVNVNQNGGGGGGGEAAPSGQ